MTLRIVVAVVVFAILALVAWYLERRRRNDPPTQRTIGEPPAQLDRNDFPHPERPWLVVLFTSGNCESCKGLAEKAAPLESADVAVTDVEYFANTQLHERYHIDAAPMTVIADAQGVVRGSFVGAFSATDLWNAVAELRAS